MTKKVEPADESTPLEAPITLSVDQIAEAAGGAAVAGASLLVKLPITTVGLINPDLNTLVM